MSKKPRSQQTYAKNGASSKTLVAVTAVIMVAIVAVVTLFNGTDDGQSSQDVSNARQARIVEVPAADGLVLGPPAGPSTRSSRHITSRGVTESFELSWNLSVRPTAEGEYEIPPITVDAAGTELRTYSAFQCLNKLANAESVEVFAVFCRRSSARLSVSGGALS